MKFLLGIPFLLIILIVFTITILVSPGALDPEAVPLFSIALPSGALWHATRGDFIVMGGIIFLFLEILKSIRFSIGAIVKHTFSMLIFIALLLQFILWSSASNSTCVLLMIISLLDVVGGFAISISKPRKDFNLGGIH
ncbi:MAG: hypothetical protein P1V20_10570 [Verrucomicrobiales bacterium]|nr:hypothetical protein [Verrucomicrobiales bacterium]